MTADVAGRIEATEAEKHMAFEFLRELATGESASPRLARLLGIALQEWHDLKSAASTIPSVWIEAIERMPRDHQHVLGWIVGGSLHHGESYIDIVMYLHGLFRMCNGTEDEPVPVTHWMPLPVDPAGRKSA